jgi:hypothetical protein
VACLRDAFEDLRFDVQDAIVDDGTVVRLRRRTLILIAAERILA